jgi:predicted XRE-type DNA-binding protein
MYEKKNNTTGRNNYYLTIEQKQEIKDYVIAHPELSQEKIAEHFCVSRTIVSNIQRTPDKYAQYEKEISKLTNQLNKAADNIFKLQNEILRLKRK